MKNQIKELRIKIDGLAQLTKGLEPVKVVTIEGHKTSKETQKAYDSLIFAKAWLGKMLGEIEVESPYPKDGIRKSVEDIELTADTHRGIKHLEEKGNWNTDYNYIEKVDWLREEIKNVIKEIKHLDGGMTNHKHQRPTREFAIARTNAYNYVCEARMWLGFELQRIK